MPYGYWYERLERYGAELEEDIRILLENHPELIPEQDPEYEPRYVVYEKPWSWGDLLIRGFQILMVLGYVVLGLVWIF